MNKQVVHETELFKVFNYGVDEVFVELKGSEVWVRLMRGGDDQLVVVAPNNLLEPYSVNGLPAFRVSKKIVFE